LDQLPNGRTPTHRDWERLSASWRSDLDERITELQHLRDRLSGCIGCGCLSLKLCKLVNPDDVLGRHGPGARNL
jgi:MerR family transcriptional regulator, redox-sensitive transcriptional activator SoxR